MHFESAVILKDFYYKADTRYYAECTLYFTLYFKLNGNQTNIPTSTCTGISFISRFQFSFMLINYYFVHIFR